ncbi:hypothetical protein GGU11DRAFT_320807 [Lentinula aff. detonsa]|nr:hypothetical protein GGU11DRAFT_320807 [Lentinula aff. detonsa]
MLLTLQQIPRNTHGLRNTIEIHRWGNIAAGRYIANTATAVQTIRRNAKSSISLVHGNPQDANDVNAKQPGESTGYDELNTERSNAQRRSNEVRRKNQVQKFTGLNPFLSSIERFIASQPSNSRLDLFIHRRLSSPQYLRQYPHTASRAALLEQLVQLLISRRRYVQAASVYNRMRDWEGFVPASGRQGGEGWKTEAMMLGMALAVSEKSPTAPVTEIDQTISTFAILFRHTLSDRLLLDLVNFLSEIGVGNVSMEKVVWVYIRCREEASSLKSDGYTPPFSIISLLAGILTRQGKIREALVFVESCDDMKSAESPYDRIIASSHPYNTIIASLSSFPAHERTEMVDLVLSIMASRGIPSDKSLINILIKDQADRANAHREASDISVLSTGPGQTQVSPNPSTIDDASEIGQIWDSISGQSQHLQINRKEQRRRRKKDQREAFETVFTLYGTLCQAHDAQESQAVSAVFPGSESGGIEAKLYTPSFRPDFFTYRTLWDLLVRRPGWRFSSSPSPADASAHLSSSEAQDATNRNRDVIEDEYGFDLTMGSDEESDSEMLDEPSSFDDDPKLSISPVLTPRKLFYDMARYHFSHLTIPPSTTTPSPQTPRKQESSSNGHALDSKTTAQSQLLLNTALLTFLNRSPSRGGADYAAAMVVLRSFRSSSMPLLASRSMQMEAWKESNTDGTAKWTTATESTSPHSCQFPQLPIPLRTYRIILTHLLHLVKHDIRLALKQGAGRGSTWARWILSIGAGDLRQFRRLLSSSPAPKHQEKVIGHDTRDVTDSVRRIKKPTEKIIERILRISSTIVPNEIRSPSSVQSSASSSPNSVWNSHLGFHHDFYYFRNHPFISSSICFPNPKAMMPYIPTYAQIFRSAPLPSWLFYYLHEPTDSHNDFQGVKGKPDARSRLGTRSLDPTPLEIMIKRAWVASNFTNYTDFPNCADYVEGEAGKEVQERVGELLGEDEDEELRRLQQLLRMFEMEVERAWKEMVPS